MKARCPKDPTHNRFDTVAHIMQSWLVDEHGEHLATRNECLQVSFPPDPGNTWTCVSCGAEATFE